MRIKPFAFPRNARRLNLQAMKVLEAITAEPRSARSSSILPGRHGRAPLRSLGFESYPGPSSAGRSQVVRPEGTCLRLTVCWNIHMQWAPRPVVVFTLFFAPYCLHRWSEQAAGPTPAIQLVDHCREVVEVQWSLSAVPTGCGSFADARNSVCHGPGPFDIPRWAGKGYGPRP